MTSHAPIRVLLVDDQRLLREGLRTLLELHPDLRVVGEAADGADAEVAVAELAPDVVLMDLRMPRQDGVTTTGRLRAQYPALPIVALTTFDDDDLVFAALDAGATGYLLKDVGADNLADAVRAAATGGAPLQPGVAAKVLRRMRAAPPPVGDARLVIGLTEREREVLGLLAKGAGNRAIAGTLSLSEGTVKNYVSSILAKTGLKDRTQAALFGRTVFGS